MLQKWTYGYSEKDDFSALVFVLSTSFVRSVVEYYYPADSNVGKDAELQEWINEIFTHGFLKNKLSGSCLTFLLYFEVVLINISL